MKTVALNTWPALSLIQEAMARGLADGGGAVVNISSGSPKKTTPSMAAYAAAKSALNALTRTLANDLGRRGVRVNAVSPGLTKTEGTRDIWGGRRRGGGRTPPAPRTADRGRGHRRGGGLPPVRGGGLDHRRPPRRGCGQPRGHRFLVPVQPRGRRRTGWSSWSRRSLTERPGGRTDGRRAPRVGAGPGGDRAPEGRGAGHGGRGPPRAPARAGPAQRPPAPRPPVRPGHLLRDRATWSARLDEPPVAGDALVAGSGRINGRPALAGAEDVTVLGGSIGSGASDKRYRLCQLARQERVPLVMMLEGAGHRVTETAAGRRPGDLMGLAELSGLVPMVSLVLGASAGHGALTAPLCDFVAMTETASIFAAGPPLVRSATGEDVTKEALGGPDGGRRLGWRRAQPGGRRRRGHRSGPPLPGPLPPQRLGVTAPAGRTRRRAAGPSTSSG